MCVLPCNATNSTERFSSRMLHDSGSPERMSCGIKSSAIHIEPTETSNSKQLIAMLGRPVNRRAPLSQEIPRNVDDAILDGFLLT